VQGRAQNAERKEQPSVNDAATLLFYVNDSRFNASLALFAITNDHEVAASLEYIHAVQFLKTMKENHDNGTIDMKERAFHISRAPKLPTLAVRKNVSDVTFEDFRATRIADAMRLAGYNYSDTINSCAQYVACQRWIKKRHAEEAKKAVKMTPLPIVVAINNESSATTGVPLLSPLSSSQSSSRTSSSSSSKQTLASKTSSSSSKLTLASKTNSKVSSRSEFAKQTTLPETRRNVQETQLGRIEDGIWKDCYNMAYKCGSLMLAAQRDGRLALDKFKGGEQIATSLNEFYGCDLITGEELSRCLRQGRAGESPPRRGPQSRIPDDEFEKLCELAFTARSIAQVNCDPNGNYYIIFNNYHFQ